MQIQQGMEALRSAAPGLITGLTPTTTPATTLSNTTTTTNTSTTTSTTTSATSNDSFSEVRVLSNLFKRSDVLFYFTVYGTNVGWDVGAK